MLTWKKAYSIDSDYVKPVHDFNWARDLAFEGWHCETPMLAMLGYRLVIRGSALLLAKYDRIGNLIDVKDFDESDFKSKQWRLWTDNGKLIKE